MRRVWGRWLAVGVFVMVWPGLAVPASAQEPGEARAWPVLLQILRDRSLITSEEYDRLLRALDPAPRGQPDGLPPSAGAVDGAGAVPLAPPADSAAADTPAGRRTSEGIAATWYDRIGLRGYTQFRYSDVLSADGAAVDVPADRSVNEAETFVVRRGRFIFSGDVSPRLYLYAQSDFNASIGTGDVTLQMRDLYADIALNASKTWRVRVGQSKVPFGFVNLQSSQNRLPFERPDALNSAVEGERDYGVYAMWASSAARQRFKDLVGGGLKGSGDYGVVAVGAYAGQGLNRSDVNGQPHVLARVSYPFALSTGQIVELGVQGYYGRFAPSVQAVSVAGAVTTPALPSSGVVDERVAVSVIWYPKPFGLESEWTLGRGPQLSADARQIVSAPVQGGYVQASYRHGGGRVLPFTRWQTFDGGRKFTRNAPASRVDEVDIGVEFSPWPEIELTAAYTRTRRRTRTSQFPYADATRGNRLGVQVQWNY